MTAQVAGYAGTRENEFFLIVQFWGPSKESLQNAQHDRSGKPWGYSSAGRAPALQAGGQEFEPPYLHHMGS